MPTLQWLGREGDLRAHERVATRLLVEEPGLGSGDAAAGGASGLLVQGDNLEALRALLPFYAGRVRCIYIDPPYNTGSAFAHYDDNLEHATWLAMMVPRLQLLREFLREDGSIWVSIDDREGHYLKVVMDEVFGRRNFLTHFIWQKSYGGGAKARWYVGLHEHILCYTKNMEQFPDMFLPPDPDVVRKYYKLRDEKFETRGPYRLQPLGTTSNDFRANLVFPISTPFGRDAIPEKQWQWSPERVAKALACNELVFTEKRDGGVSVAYKQYLKNEEGEERRRKPRTIISNHYTQHGSDESRTLFGLQDKFPFPKPEGLIQLILEGCTGPGDLVLDSFLGSGTTAAVAHKMGRPWIGVEMGEHARTHCARRLARVVEGEQGGISQAVGWQGGGSFRFLTLGAALFDAEGRIDPAIRFPDLAAHVWFSETRTPLPGAPVDPVLGRHGDRHVALLYNGILKDRAPRGGNVLTHVTLAALRAAAPDGPLTVFAAASRLSDDTLRARGVTFRQTPYDLRGRG